MQRCGVCRSEPYDEAISREFVIAMGPAAATVLALVSTRWRAIQRVWSGPNNQLYVGATLVCLGISMIAAPLAIETKHPSALDNMD
jgi:hypothetical protein